MPQKNKHTSGYRCEIGLKPHQLLSFIAIK